MADASTLSPEARQAIILHLQGGGDPAHATAIASGAITPELAQQLAAQSGDSNRLLTLPQMREMLAAPQDAAPSLGTPALSAPDSNLASTPDPLQALAASNPAPSVASSMPAATTQLGAANQMVDAMADQGRQLSAQGANRLQQVIPLQASAQVEQQKALTLKEQHDLKIGRAQKQVLDDTAAELQTMQDEDKARYNQRQQRLDQMLNQMTDAANVAAQAAPHDFWADKSTPSRIFGIISQIAGGMANGLANQPGQPTPLDRVIQADLDRQKLDFAQKSQSGNQAAGIYNDLIKATNSDIAASGAFKIAAYKKAIAQMQAALASDPEGAGAQALQQGIADAQQSIATTAQSVGKTELEGGNALQEKAAANQTSTANKEIDSKTDIGVANINAASKERIADKTAKDAGKRFFPANTYAIPGQEEKAAQGIPEKFQIPIFNSTTGLTSLRKEVAAVEQLWNDKSLPTGVRDKAIADHQQTIVRDLSKVYNAGNRVAGGVYDEMAGEVPAGMIAKIGKYWTDENVFDSSTLAALRETVRSSEDYVDTELKPFGQTIRVPKAAQ